MNEHGVWVLERLLFGVLQKVLWDSTLLYLELLEAWHLVVQFVAIYGLLVVVMLPHYRGDRRLNQIGELILVDYQRTVHHGLRSQFGVINLTVVQLYFESRGEHFIHLTLPCGLSHLFDVLLDGLGLVETQILDASSSIKALVNLNQSLLLCFDLRILDLELLRLVIRDIVPFKVTCNLNSTSLAVSCSHGLLQSDVLSYLAEVLRSGQIERVVPLVSSSSLDFVRHVEACVAQQITKVISLHQEGLKRDILAVGQDASVSKPTLVLLDKLILKLWSLGTLSGGRLLILQASLHTLQLFLNRALPASDRPLYLRVVAFSRSFEQDLPSWTRLRISRSDMCSLLVHLQLNDLPIPVMGW